MHIDKHFIILFCSLYWTITLLIDGCICINKTSLDTHYSSYLSAFLRFYIIHLNMLIIYYCFSYS